MNIWQVPLQYALVFPLKDSNAFKAVVPTAAHVLKHDESVVAILDTTLSSINDNSKLLAESRAMMKTESPVCHGGTQGEHELTIWQTGEWPRQDRHMQSHS